MLFAGEKSKTETFEEIEAGTMPEVTVTPVAVEATESELFDLYDKIAHTKKTGARDAQIFEAIREWTFSDFTIPAHEFAGISIAMLRSWQKRHCINLSGGHIRPDHIDLARGHAWGTTRRGDHVNGRHTIYGPPSREEMIEMMGSAG